MPSFFTFFNAPRYFQVVGVFDTYTVGMSIFGMSIFKIMLSG